MVKRIRNRAYLPYVSTEGVLTKPFPFSSAGTKGSWYKDLSPFERCYIHQTLASVRRYAHFKPHGGLIPKDNLDFKIVSTYNHSRDSFPDPVDPCMQAETMGITTWRRLRNTRDIQPERFAKGADLSCFLEGNKPQIRYNISHPVFIGGIIEKEHPSHVKLMNSSHHSPQTNAGYTRKESYGTFFQY